MQSAARADVGPATQEGGAQLFWYSGLTFVVSNTTVSSTSAIFIGESDLRERLSGTTCSFPGIWVGWKEYIRDLILQLTSLGFGMLMIGCGPSMLMRGLWSKASVKVFIPNKKNLHLSMAHTAASM